MKPFRNLYLIPIVVQTIVILASRPGGPNGIGSAAKAGAVGGPNHNGIAGANGHSSSGSKTSNQNGSGGGFGGGSGNTNGDGSVNSHNQGQSNVHGSQGISSIVNSIHSADQQVHTVNLAIRSIRAGGTIEHLDSTLQSLSSTITTASTALNVAGKLHAEDLQSIKLAIQPLHQSIGTLISQLVSRRDTIARLCGCRVVEEAVNQIRGSSRTMFDGIKSHWSQGGAHHGKHGFGGLNSLDSGIASFLNHGFAAFGFGNCVDIVAPSSELSSSYTTTQTSTWAPSTALTTMVVTNTVTKTVISTSWYSEVQLYQYIHIIYLGDYYCQQPFIQLWWWWISGDKRAFVFFGFRQQRNQQNFEHIRFELFKLDQCDKQLGPFPDYRYIHKHVMFDLLQHNKSIYIDYYKYFYQFWFNVYIYTHNHGEKHGDGSYCRPNENGIYIYHHKYKDEHAEWIWFRNKNPHIDADKYIYVYPPQFSFKNNHGD
ncbi:hypothetical protein F4677DRAFT_462333 [Hypoxylon crocopeplum]|nr:hypothetical protein F4677DRAFT_462333 [Hypoxylon crocopeplum]